ncbi:MAG: MFS transporter [Burkholderiaceae bacterium]
MFDSTRHLFTQKLVRPDQSFFYGWVMLSFAGLGLFASGPGQSHTFSVFLDPIGQDLGLGKSLIASAYGLASLVAALLLPLMGKLLDKRGPRQMLFVVTILLGFACMAFGAVGGLVTLSLSFGALRFLGQGSLMMGCANLTAQWFSRRRGFAMSLMALGFAGSMAIHPPLGEFLIAEIGWRKAWLVLGLLTWALLLPPILLLVHDKPEPLGLMPDGERPTQEQPTEAVDGLTLKEALRTRAFYLVTTGWFSIGMLVTTLHFYQISILESQGIARNVAASVFPVSALAMVLTMPLVGMLFDRVKTRLVFGMGLVVLALGLVGITFVTDTTTAIAFAIVFGITNAFSMTMFGYLMPRFFGRQHLGSIQGTTQMIAVVGASLGPLPVGLAFDYLGDPTNTLRWLALFPVLCAIAAVLFLRTPAGIKVPNGLE